MIFHPIPPTQSCPCNPFPILTPDELTGLSIFAFLSQLESSIVNFTLLGSGVGLRVEWNGILFHTIYTLYEYEYIICKKSPLAICTGQDRTGPGKMCKGFVSGWRLEM